MITDERIAKSECVSTSRGKHAVQDKLKSEVTDAKMKVGAEMSGSDRYDLLPFLKCAILFDVNCVELYVRICAQHFEITNDTVFKNDVFYVLRLYKQL